MARKPTLGTRYSRIRTIVKKTLEDRKVYDPSDELLIDELLFNIKISDDAKRDIQERGYQINVVRDRLKLPYFQQNTSVSTYLQAVKSIGNILTKLGITVQERTSLKITPDEPDLLGDLFSSVRKETIKQ